MKILLSSSMRDKLASKQPPVTETEVVECFANQTHEPLIDRREEHLTNPPTRWFVAETNYGRRLKVMYVPMEGSVRIKSAYDASQDIIRIYNKYARPIGEET